MPANICLAAAVGVQLTLGSEGGVGISSQPPRRGLCRKTWASTQPTWKDAWHWDRRGMKELTADLRPDLYHQCCLNNEMKDGPLHITPGVDTP